MILVQDTETPELSIGLGQGGNPFTWLWSETNWLVISQYTVTEGPSCSMIIPQQG